MPDGSSPPPLVLHCPTLTSVGGGRRAIRARIELGGRDFTLYYTFEGEVPEARADALLSATLLAAMASGSPVESEAGVSSRLLDQVPSIEEIYAAWVPRLRPVPVTADRVPSAGPRGGRGASFFTAGLDSYYTLLSHDAEIDAIIFVHGFASPVQGPARERTSKTLQRVARDLGKRLVEVETNLAALFDEWLGPGPNYVAVPPHRLSNFELAHGAALASVAHLLPDSIGRVYIAAGHNYDRFYAWGSHPSLDPKWSSDRVEFRHDGAGATRVEKARLVGRHRLALETLRVCPGATDTGSNCGRCEKCIRTMVNLRIAGALQPCAAFAEPLDLRRVALIRTPAFKPFLRQNLVEARDLGTDPELVAALQRAVHPWRPGRIALEVGLVGWKAMKRLLPVEYSGRRIRWR